MEATTLLSRICRTLTEPRQDVRAIVEEAPVTSLHPQDIALAGAAAGGDRPDGVAPVGGVRERAAPPGGAAVARAPALHPVHAADLAREQDHPRVLVVERDAGCVAVRRQAPDVLGDAAALPARARP